MSGVSSIVIKRGRLGEVLWVVFFYIDGRSISTVIKRNITRVTDEKNKQDRNECPDMQVREGSGGHQMNGQTGRQGHTGTSNE